MLGEGPDPRDVLGAVAGLLRDADIDVRLAAARALGNYQSETSVLSLSNVANDPSMEMRLVAIEAIGRTRMPSAFSVLMTLLEDPMPAARIAAVRAMSETASAAWLPDLEAALGRAADAQMAAELQALVERLRTGAP
jgi:HEAT repeat protein